MKRFLVTGTHIWSRTNNPAKSGFRAVIIASSEHEILTNFNFNNIEDLKIEAGETVSLPILIHTSHSFVSRR